MGAPGENIDNDFNQLRDDYSQLMAASREATLSLAQLKDLSDQGSRIAKKPSIIKYLILIYLAIIVDVIDLLDILSPTTGGLVLILTKIISLCATFLIILIVWITDTDLKKSESYKKEAARLLEVISEAISRATRIAVKAARLMKRTKALAPLSSKLMRKIAGARRYIRRSPMGRVILGGALNLVPILAVVPWMSVFIILAYTQERSSYREAQKLKEQIDNEIKESSESVGAINSVAREAEGGIGQLEDAVLGAGD